MPTLNVECPEIEGLSEGQFPQARPLEAVHAQAAGSFGDFEEVLAYLNGNEKTGSQMIECHFQEPEMAAKKAQAEQDARNSPLDPPTLP